MRLWIYSWHLFSTNSQCTHEFTLEFPHAFVASTHKTTLFRLNSHFVVSFAISFPKFPQSLQARNQTPPNFWLFSSKKLNLRILFFCPARLRIRNLWNQGWGSLHKIYLQFRRFKWQVRRNLQSHRTGWESFWYWWNCTGWNGLEGVLFPSFGRRHHGHSVTMHRPWKYHKGSWFHSAFPNFRELVFPSFPKVMI